MLFFKRLTILAGFVLFTFSCEQANRKLDSNKSQKGENDLGIHDLSKDTITLPLGVTVFKELKVDFNKDGKEDFIHIIQPSEIDSTFLNKENPWDYNRRCVIIHISNKNGWVKAVSNLRCFDSGLVNTSPYYGETYSVRKDTFKVLTHEKYAGLCEYNFVYKGEKIVLVTEKNESNPYYTPKTITKINYVAKTLSISSNLTNHDKEPETLGCDTLIVMDNEEYCNIKSSIEIDSLTPLSNIFSFMELNTLN